MNLKISELHRDYIEVFNAGEIPVTGLVQDDFDIELIVNGSLASKAVTITEVNPTLNPGVYEVSFTPDTLGGWYLHITQSTYSKTGWKELYKVTQYEVDDILDTYGLGDKRVTITVTDEDTGNPIEGVLVEVFNSALTSRVIYAYTNANGITPTLWLYAGDYKVVCKKFGYYTFDNPFDLTVAVDMNLDIEGAAFAPTPAWSPDLCTVYGWVVDSQQNPQQETVYAKLLNDAYYLDNKQIAVVNEKSVTARSSDGYWEIPLTRTVDSMNDDMRYEFKIGDTPVGVFNIPDQDSISLKELAEAQQDED